MFLNNFYQQQKQQVWQIVPLVSSLAWLTAFKRVISSSHFPRLSVARTWSKNTGNLRKAICWSLHWMLAQKQQPIEHMQKTKIASSSKILSRRRKRKAKRKRKEIAKCYAQTQ